MNSCQSSRRIRTIYVVWGSNGSMAGVVWGLNEALDVFTGV